MTSNLFTNRGLSQSGAEYKVLKKAASLDSYGIDPYVVSVSQIVSFC